MTRNANYFADTFRFFLLFSSFHKNDRFSEFTLVNYMSNIADENWLKFDVVIGNYAWVSKSTDAVLILVLSQTLSANTYFEINTTAMADSGVVDVSVYESNGGKKYITYSHFEGTLRHDPTFGIRAEEGGVKGAAADDTKVIIDPVVVAASNVLTAPSGLLLVAMATLFAALM